MAIEEVLRDALALSDEDREQLLAALHRSLEPDDGEILTQPEWDAAWAAEIDRRLNDLAAGRARTYTHQEVMAELRSRLLRR
ncbi:MAG TPA: addiction module protein [Kofleriaceae bacterium]|nr:addiction module protein [Kofleriaceae bacterium]